jgi:hypothetical protein
MMQADWRATGWLGIVLAGALWTCLQNDSFEDDIRALVGKIQAAVPNSGRVDDLGMSHNELRDELSRLRADISLEDDTRGDFVIDLK